MKKRKLKHRLKRKNKSFNYILILIILIFAIYLLPKAVSVAKYVYNSVHENYLSSKDFYFSSDKLKLGGVNYEVTNNWSGVRTCEVPINMTSKRNDKAYTDADIEYTISCTSSPNVEATLSKTSGTIVGKGNDGINLDSFTVYIDPAPGYTLSDTEVAWVDVTAKATSPYKQTLTGRLYVEVGSADIHYEILDSVNSPYLTVNITNSQSVGANVTLSYSPQNVLIDMTSHFYLNATGSTTTTYDGSTYLNSVTSAVGALSTTSVKFYKQNASSDYSYISGSVNTPIISLTH